MSSNAPDDASALRHLYLIDGSGFIFRAFHALPPLTRPDGTPVNAVLGFTNMLWKILRETDADHAAVIFDTARLTFRNEIYEPYKANRGETPEELIPQFPLVREAAGAFNLASIELEGFEADDLIAAYAVAARARGARVTIVSADKDLMQLVEGDSVIMYDYFKNREIGPDQVQERFGVGPERVIDVQALAGDSSDNVPGVPGIGVKTAAQLINDYGDLDELLARAEEIKQPKRRQNLIEHAEMARVSRELVTLRRDAPLPMPLEALARRQPEPGALRAFFQENGFRSIAARLDGEDGESRLAEEEAEPEETAALPAAYPLVTDAQTLAQWAEKARESGVLALEPFRPAGSPEGAGLAGLALATAPGDACYVPLGHAGPDLLGAEEAIPQLDIAEALATLDPVLRDPGVLKLALDIKQTVRLLALHGARLAPVDDPMLASWVLDGSLHGHGLEDLTQLHLDRAAPALADVLGSGRSRVSVDAVSPEALRDTAAAHADLALRLHRVIRPRLVADRLTTVFERIERPLIGVLARMEAAGILVDQGELVALSADFAGRIEALESAIHALAGHPFTIGSPKQLGEVLFDEMGLQSGRKGKSGAYSTGADILEELAAQGHDLPARVLDWRQLTKLKSTYTDALIEHIDPATRRVHTTFTMTAANTGRLSSNDPNLQNIPIRTEEGRRIRRAFVAAPGHVLMSADYSQIELRILAHVAGVDPLKDAFREGIDIHALTASQVFDVPLEGMDPMVRRSAKAINFGIIYGISPFGLARQIGVPQAEAKGYIEAYFVRYPGIKDYMEHTKKAAHAEGFVTTLFGRKCRLPGINDRNPARRAFSERAAINAPIQGAAADVIKRAMIPMQGALETQGLGARMLLQVHDELVFEVPEAEVEETGAVVKRVMEGAAHLDVPLTVDVGTGGSWAEAH
ncbi:MAG: DNA polymerase I [Rhodospirillales bacterium]|nr:DNA polymerase I [Rhodospirillales bacterium]MDE0382207.1 DNA polymerase I [Rhodospirillales bacterium]